jgi:hypothetical protein
MADVLEQFFAGGKTEAPPAKPSTPSVSQSKRDLDAMAILQDELSKAQKRASSGDPRAARDVEALQREIAGRNKTIKKSLNGFIFPLKSKEYLLEASDIPATNAPISIEKPRA